MIKNMNMSTPKLTVLMALYNGGDYLKHSIGSVLNQTYADFDFLIVDDCSTDHSLKIIESFHDRRIKIYHNAKNLGQTKSLNLGLKLAEGDYIARMDGDDIALPQWLEAQVNYIKRNPGCSVVSSYAIAIDEQNKIKKIYKPPSHREDIILRSLIASPINHVGSVFKKKDVIENDGYDESYIIAADYALWGKLLRNNFQITTTPKILMAIREHTRSVSRSEQGRQNLEEIKKIAGRNISQFVNEKFSEDEINLFCRANYDEGSLTDAEFNRAVGVTKRVYAHLAPSLKVREAEKNRWTRQRCQTIYLKRIFYAIIQKDYNTAKELSFKGMREFGLLNVLTAFGGISALNGRMLGFIPGLYAKILEKNARFQLNFSRNVRNIKGMGMFT